MMEVFEVTACWNPQMKSELKTEESGDGSSSKSQRLIPQTNGLDPEQYCQRFWNFCYTDAAGPLEAVDRLKEFCHGWLRPEIHSKEQIIEMLVLEKFLTLLPRELQLEMRNCRTQRIREAVALAERYCRENVQMKNECLVTFEDVFLQFSVEEWKLLDRAQKTLYHRVMQENYEHVIFLGLKIKNDDGDHQPVPPSELEIQAPRNGRPRVPRMLTGTENPSGTHGKREQHQNFPGKKSRTHSISEQELPQHTGFHKQGYLGERPFKCQECAKSFRMNCELTKHQKIHSEEKPYKCEQCGKAFRRTSDCNRHLLTHWGVKPYKCSWCGKSFTHNTNLHTHERIHTGEKPYECPDCGRRFSQNSHLVKHRTTHTGEKPYTCITCERNFSRQSSLVRHQKVHRTQEAFPMSPSE